MTRSGARRRRIHQHLSDFRVHTSIYRLPRSCAPVESWFHACLRPHTANRSVSDHQHRRGLCTTCLGLCLSVGSLLTRGMVVRLGNVPALLLGWMRGADTWVDHADGDTLNQVPHLGLVNLIPSTALAGLGQVSTFAGPAWRTSQHCKPVRKAPCLRRFGRFHLESDPRRLESFAATS